MEICEGNNSVALMEFTLPKLYYNSIAPLHSIMLINSHHIALMELCYINGIILH